MQLDAVTSQVAAPRQITDVHPLLHVNRVSLRREQRLHWYITILAALYTSTILEFLCFYIRSHLCTKISNCWTGTNAPQSDTTYQHITTSTVGPSKDASGPTDEDARGNVVFTSLHIRYDMPTEELTSDIDLARLATRRKTHQTMNPTSQYWLQTPRLVHYTDEHDWGCGMYYRVNAVFAVLTQQNTGGQTGARSTVCGYIQSHKFSGRLGTFWICMHRNCRTVSIVLGF